jgi:hypothetical protein
MLVGMPEPIPDVFADAELAAYVTSIRAEQGPSARQLGVAAVRQAQRLHVSQPSAREKATGWGLDSDDVARGADL